MPGKIKSASQIAWIAGILEGEGTFSCNDNGTSAVIKVAMNDKDVIERFADITNYNGTIGEYKLRTGTTQYVVQIYGIHAIEWMMTIYSLMGKRRQEKIKSVLILWKEYERQYKDKCVNGHEYTSDNIYYIDGIRKGCLVCRKENSKKYGERRRDPMVIIAELFGVTEDEAREMIEAKQRTNNKI